MTVKNLLHARAAAGPLAASTLFAVLAASHTARAQDTNIAVAETLFREGRTLMAAGNFATACPKFEESNRVDPKLGTLLNLALCHEKSGRTASAWAEYAEAASLAARAGQPDREKVAREHAAALEPTLAHVVIDADPKSDAVVALDDQPIGRAAYRSPIPIDPGAHVLRATAPGATPFEQSFRVAQGAPVATLKVPALAPAPIATAPVVAEAPPPVDNRSGLRKAGFITGGVGLVLTGIGAYFGARAFSDKSSAENECGATFCTPAGSSATSAMKTDETLSTIGVIAGVAAIGAGAYLVFSNSGESGGSPGTVRASVGLGGPGLKVQIVW
jgi:hypothetical protein